MNEYDPWSGRDRDEELKTFVSDEIKAMAKSLPDENTFLDHYMHATHHAHRAATEMVRTVDMLFYADSRVYEASKKEVFKEVIGNMILALNNTESEIDYDDDPEDKAEIMLDDFGWDAAEKLQKIIDEDDEKNQSFF